MSFYLRLAIKLDAETNPVVLFISHISAHQNSEIASAGLPLLIALLAVFLVVWLSTQSHNSLVSDRQTVPFLPVNPEFSATRNQVSALKSHIPHLDLVNGQHNIESAGYL